MTKITTKGNISYEYLDKFLSGLKNYGCIEYESPVHGEGQFNRLFEFSLYGEKYTIQWHTNQCVLIKNRHVNNTGICFDYVLPFNRIRSSNTWPYSYKMGIHFSSQSNPLDTGEGVLVFVLKLEDYTKPEKGNDN